MFKRIPRASALLAMSVLFFSLLFAFEASASSLSKLRNQASVTETVRAMMAESKERVIRDIRARALGKIDGGVRLFSALSSVDWFATRTVLWGIGDLDKIDTELSEDKLREYDDAVFSAWLDALVESYSGDSEKATGLFGKSVKERRLEILEKYGGSGDTAGLKSDLVALAADVFGADVYDATIAGGMGRKSVDFLMEETGRVRAVAEMAKKARGIPGLDTSGGAPSMFDMMMTVGKALALLFLAVKLGQTMFRYLTGEGEIDTLRDVMKYIALAVFLFMMKDMMCHLVAFSDSLREAVLGEGAAAAFSRANAIIELRTAYTDGGGILSSLTLSAITARICGVLAQTTTAILLIFGDVLLALTLLFGPLTVSMAILNGFSSYFDRWLGAVFSFLVYPVAAAVYLRLALVITIVGVDTSGISLIIMSVCYMMGAAKVPSLASRLNGAVMQATTSTLTMAAPNVAGAAAASGVRAASSAAGAGPGAGRREAT